MNIDAHTGEAFFQVAAVAATAVTALLLVFSRQIRGGLARVRRQITRSQHLRRVRRTWRD